VTTDRKTIRLRKTVEAQEDSYKKIHLMSSTSKLYFITWQWSRYFSMQSKRKISPWFMLLAEKE
jgi:hypothetical protein